MNQPCRRGQRTPTRPKKSPAAPAAPGPIPLAAFAICGGLSLATLDHDFKAYEPHGLNLLLPHS